jgi:hypothetical protein
VLRALQNRDAARRPARAPETARLRCAVRLPLAMLLVLSALTAASAQTAAGETWLEQADASANEAWPVPPLTPPVVDDNSSSSFRRPPTESTRLHEVQLDEATGTAKSPDAPRGAPFEFLHFPTLTEPAELDLVGWPGLSLPALPSFFGRLRGEYADDFDTQSRIGGSALLRMDDVYGFDLEWNYRREDLARSRHDKLWTGDANFVFHLASFEMVSLRAGGGVAWVVDDSDTEAGFNLTYGADFFIKRPWMMTLEFDFGRVGGDSLSHARGTIGYVWGQIELYTGWDWFELDDREFDGVIAGVTLWF